MRILPVKGMRDFYPAEMAVRNYIMDHWRAVSVRNGFQEYDGPILEYLQLYTLKSGQEIVEQLFALKDRGGRELAIRPEMTPTLARMVCQRLNSLPRPIKWFSIPRLCRAERPQKGRLREFFQWNIDIIGVEDVLADAEIIFCMLDFLQAVGLTSQDIMVKISSRKLLSELLIQMGLPQQQLCDVFSLLDKKSKLGQEQFESALSGLVPDARIREGIANLMAVKDLQQVGAMVGSESATLALGQLERLFDLLGRMGVAQFCRFDIGIVRGLAYYTGVVFEVYEASDQLRAIAGGGRYDNLLTVFGGPAVPATGMGMGDCVLEIVLREKGLLGSHLDRRPLDYFVAFTDQSYMDAALQVASTLRRSGFSAGFSYRPVALGKQIKQASDQGYSRCIILGQEFQAGQIIVKDLSSGQQQLMSLDQLISSSRQADLRP